MTTQNNNRPVTAEVQQFANLNRDGDMIPHNWNKFIGRWHEFKSKKGEMKHSWRSHPFAERLLARIVWYYTPTPVMNASGDVMEYKRKFNGPYWEIRQKQMAKAFGCSRRTIVDELALLRELGLVRTEDAIKRSADDPQYHAPIFVIPIFDAIAKITGRGCEVSAPVGCAETSQEGCEVSAQGGVKKVHNSSIPSSIPLSSIPKEAEKIAAIAATPKPARKAKSKKTQPPEPEGDTQNGTLSPLQQSPIDDDISRAPAKTPDAPPVKPTATPRPRNVMFDKLAAMTHTTGAMAGPQIGKLIKQLKASGYDETHLANFELWWCQDWRSKDKQGNRGIVPTVGQIGQLFGVAMAWAEKHAPKPAPIVEQLSPEDAAALEARLMAEYEANEAEMNRRRIAAGYIKA
jgi:hypothetical protein